MRNQLRKRRPWFAGILAMVMVLSLFAPAAGANPGNGNGNGGPHQVTVEGGPPAHAQGPKRAVEDVDLISSSQFLVDFDKTYPKGIPISRMIDVEVTLEDGTVIEPVLTGYEVSRSDRSQVIVDHVDDDLEGLAGILTIDETETAFDFRSDEGDEGPSIQDVRDAELGTEHTVGGTVTAMFEAGGQTNLYMQDETAGLLVRGAGLGDRYEIGDRIEATGSLDAFRDMLQLLTNADDTVLLDEQAGMPEPKTVTSEDLNEANGEAFEAQLVVVEDARVQEKTAFDDFRATDAFGDFVVLASEAAVQEQTDYDAIVGVVNYHFYEHKVMPRFAEDVIEDATAVQPVRATPEEGQVAEGTLVTLTSFTEDAVIHYTTDGSEPTADSPVFEAPIAITDDLTIRAVAVKEDMADSPVRDFAYSVLPTAGEVAIYDIQGSAHLSPYEGMQVLEVPGIVTHTQGNGFYMQSEASDGDVNTSEGIFVYMPNHGVSVGDAVGVDGRVTEYEEDGFDGNDDLTTTQIVGSSVTVDSSGNALPDPVVIGVDRDIPSVLIEDPDEYDIYDGDTFDAEANALDFYESLEGMLVEIPGQVTVTGPQKYNELTVISEEWDLSNRTPDGGVYLTETDLNTEIMFVNVPWGTVAKTGDYFEEGIQGVLGYNYGNYKLEPVGDLPELQDGGTERREETTLSFDEEKLTVATYNVENYYPGVPEEKTERLANSMANELDAPDIITLVEVMDNDGTTDSGNTDASDSYQELIDAIRDNGGPNYAFTDIAPLDGNDGGIPGGNIRVGHLYRTDRVHVAEGETGTATDALAFDESGELNFVTGLIDPENEAFTSARKPLLTEFVFKGESVYVIGNHWNSKRGDDAPFGMVQPAEQGSREQREEIAGVIHDFVDELKTHQPEANVVVLGDFNDFPWSPPLEVLEGDGMLYNSIYEQPRDSQYTYNYNGSSQSLDSILVSDHLSEGLEVDIMNINSGFMEEHGRASDHDPMVVQLAIPDIDPDYDMGDVTAPEITFVDEALNEEAVLTLDAGDTFTVPEVTAVDEVDGDVTDQVEVANPVDESTPGTYEVRYTVTDEAGNTAVKTLQVIVRSTADALEELANGSFADWTDGLPDLWMGEATNIAMSRVHQTNDAFTGDFAVQLENTGTSHNRFTSDAYQIEEGALYEVRFMVKGDGEIRNAMYAPGYHGNNYSNYSAYTVLDERDWQEVVWSYEAPGNGEAELIFSVRNTSGDHLLVDDVVIEKVDE